jgi:phosphoadenosine phosphosulfate reductase
MTRNDHTFDTAHRALHWAVHRFPRKRLAVVSAFGPGTLAVIHMLSEMRLQVPVVFIDTLHHFPETLDLVERVRIRYNLDLRVFRPAESLHAFEEQHGPRLWERDVERYQQIAKVEPFRRATAGLDAYITGRRRDQAETRDRLAVIESGKPAKINPLAGWSRAEIWRFIHTHDIPYNALHDEGYTSIGDAPLTTPVKAGEHERAGRWRGLGKLECGIHM